MIMINHLCLVLGVKVVRNQILQVNELTKERYSNISFYHLFELSKTSKSDEIHLPSIFVHIDFILFC